ncbi:MAG: class I SAM-dependent methyltransferase [Caldilinea sp. CFX5]|nr:class I SAM-dependent methyltransferase [Caldilinea sp. CFX5]
MTYTGNEAQVVQEQYRNSANLDARIRLHQLFSTNPYRWLRWVFDQIAAPAETLILEVGCGPASLWVENSDRIPAGWQITLTDQSPGMIAQAQQNLAATAHPFQFAQMDAQALDFADGAFDAVIANHMLYHVPDLPRALSEIRRVLKPGGRLYAATNGKMHMAELRTLIQSFDPALDYMATAAPPERFFSLENGAAHLTPWFADLALRHYEDRLAVTEVAALVDYVFSMMTFTGARYDNPATARAAFTAHAAAQMAQQGGVFTIQKATGLFIATK